MNETDELLEFDSGLLEDIDFYDEDDVGGLNEDFFADEHDHFGEAEDSFAEFEYGEFESAEFEDIDGEFEALIGAPDFRAESETFEDFEFGEDFEDFDFEEYEDDFEDYEDFEGDYLDGDDEFFKSIGRFVKKAARGVGKLVKKGVRVIGKFAGPLLKILGPVAAKIVGTAIGGPAGAAIAGSIASAILKEAEYEDEGDAEAAIAEDEGLLGGIGVDQAEYDQMAAAAFEMSDAEDEASSNRALRRMIAHGVRAFRRNRKVRRYIPQIMRAAIALAKTFKANRRTRWAVPLIPLIVSRTMLRLSRMRRITKRVLVEAMSTETAWVLADPRRAKAAHNVMRRRAMRGRRRRGRSGRARVRRRRRRRRR